MDAQHLTVAGSAAMGAVVQETIYWYNLRHKLEAEEYRALIRSAKYWAVVSAMIIVTAVVSLIWYSGEDNPGARAAFTFGVGLPLLVKQLGQAATPSVRLGHGTRGYFS
jgi:hypothetical protein